VNETDQILNTRYHTQVKPREINLFFLSENSRSRIVRTGSVYEVLNSKLKFSKEEILSEVDNHPENFSPNVILRPVYQELLLPNLAYVGGPAETAYWFQFKKVFDHHKVFFPLLVPRNHAMILEPKPWKHWQKLGLGYAEIFVDRDQLVNNVVKALSGDESVTADAMLKLGEVYQTLLEQAGKTDVTLRPAVEAQLQKTMRGLERIEKKHFSALKRKHELVIRHIDEMMELAKPGGIPQERVMSFVTLYAQHGDAVLDVLMNELVPFSDTFTVIHPH
jgi:bacillithiol biosynthesis cysteine-adding enzyme BshC